MSGRQGNRSVRYAAVLGAALALTTAPALAQDAVNLTPPVTASAAAVSATTAVPTDPAAPEAASGTSDDSVFSWQEIPANQQVPITRAVFDKGGYELYDTVGETITVPFVNNKLDVMKFARSTTGDMYFVNEGSAPILYVPDGGYLENASVSGAKWYPFTSDYQQTDPQYLGIAPDYSDFTDMDWYPDMDYYGGYCGCGPFTDDDYVVPEAGLSIVVGGYPSYGWGGYCAFCRSHPAGVRSALVFAADYVRGASHTRSGRVFGGVGRHDGRGWSGTVGSAGAGPGRVGRGDGGTHRGLAVGERSDSRLPTPSTSIPTVHEAPRPFLGARSAYGGFGSRGAEPFGGDAYRPGAAYVPGGYSGREPVPYSPPRWYNGFGVPRVAPRPSESVPYAGGRQFAPAPYGGGARPMAGGH
jgi:hypothetical protein